MSLLKGRNVVITGATRGIGRGLAVGFAEQGANVYITGRTEGPGPGSLQEVAGQVRAVGGNCSYYVVDHNDDLQVERFFDQLVRCFATDGSKLDVFVNNAYSAVGFLMDSIDIPFWKKSVSNPGVADSHSNPGKCWDLINGVGLRNNYVCAARAIRIMEPQGSGLIVNITSWAGLVSIFDPAYAIGKEALDRMSAEIALAAPEGVRSIAFCPGFVSTEDLLEAATKAEELGPSDDRGPRPESLPTWNSETPLFVGRVLAVLASEKGERLLPRMNGKVVIAAEAADVLGVNDENGFRALSFRSIRFNLMSMLPVLRESPVTKIIPRTLCAPWPIVRWLSGAGRFWN